MRRFAAGQADNRTCGREHLGSDPRGAARSGHIETRGRERGHEGADRIALAVEAARVHERDVARQPVHLVQQLRNGNREPEVDERLRDSASVIPVCWVADARLVSPRLEGWAQDILGDVDYTQVSIHA